MGCFIRACVAYLHPTDSKKLLVRYTEYCLCARRQHGYPDPNKMVVNYSLILSKQTGKLVEMKGYVQNGTGALMSLFNFTGFLCIKIFSGEIQRARIPLLTSAWSSSVCVLGTKAWPYYRTYEEDRFLT